MTTHIALLRGINVGGHKKILMADLRVLIEQLGHSQVKTYIQTGNILFTHTGKKDNLNLAKNIAQAIHDNYGFDVPVMVRTTAELKTVVDQNPYYAASQEDIEHLHLTLLEKKTTEEVVLKVEEFDARPDQFEILDTNVYLHIARPYRETKLGNNFFEKKLQVSATTRNWKTIIKLWELSQS